MPLSYDLVEFNMLGAGALKFRAPIIKGAIQIGLPEAEEEIKKELDITVEPPEIRIARVDRQPFQIEHVSFDEGFNAHRASVLGEPVDELVFRQSSQYGIWDLVGGEGLRVLDPETMEKFAGLIAVFALEEEYGRNGIFITAH